MLEFMLKRAMPFALTLLVGTGLGSIFGFNQPSPRTDGLRVFRSERHSRCPSEKRRAFTNPSSRHSTPLEITYQPNTRLTPEAVRNDTTGVVKLLVRFNADGTTTVVERLSTLPDGLTQEAVRVAEQTRFNPKTVNGEPVTVTEDKEYVFSLSEQVQQIKH